MDFFDSLKVLQRYENIKVLGDYFFRNKFREVSEIFYFVYFFRGYLFRSKNYFKILVVWRFREE